MLVLPDKDQERIHHGGTEYTEKSESGEEQKQSKMEY